jgi:hypothetical protein
MKLRNGFVSNSSSSSFICDISGGSEGGFDVCLSDVGMVECENGHTFYKGFLLNENFYEDLEELFSGEELPTVEEVMKVCPDEESAKEQIEFYKKNGYLDEDMKYGYEIPKAFCPICQMESFARADLVKFALKKLNMTENDLAKEAKTTFKNYKDFKEYLK